MLGRALGGLLGRDPRLLVAALPRAELDITADAPVAEVFRTLAPKIVLNAAAYTDVDGCERDPERARRGNAEGPRVVAEACRATGAFLVHLSTDFVFDGTLDRPYRETDAPAPVSAYGASKLEGERLVAAACPGALIVRTAWTFGAGRDNFVTKVLRRARAGGPLSVVTDQTGSPTWTEDLAKAIMALVKAGATGTFHVVNAGTASRHELAVAALAAAGLGAVPVAQARTVPAPGIAARPAYSVLDTAAFTRRTGRAPRPWREALRDYVLTLGAAA